MLSKTGLSWIWVGMLVIVLDQLSKFWIATRFDLHESYTLLPFFGLYLAHNSGAAFSLMHDSPELAKIVFSSVAGAVTLGLTIWLYYIPARLRWTAISIALILGGAVGNLIDRVRFGFVVDFFDLFVGAWHWPIFNVADIAIDVGAAMMIIEIIFFNKHREQKA